MPRAKAKQHRIWLLGLALAAGSACVKDAGDRIQIKIVNGGGARRPESVKFFWLDAHGYIFPAQTIAVEAKSKKADTADLGSVFINVTRATVSSGDPRPNNRWAVARGLVAGEIVSEGTVAVTLGKKLFTLALVLYPGRRADKDGDGLPDDADPCPDAGNADSFCLPVPVDPAPDAGNDAGLEKPGGGSDATPDALPDAPPFQDGPDDMPASLDLSSDVARDAVPDAAPDAARDVTPDLPPDLPPAASTFSYRRDLVVDRTKVGTAGAPATLMNFPALVNFADATFKSAANGGHVQHPQGFDIVFRASDAATCAGPAACSLDHEIEKYDPSTGEIVAWVRLPSVNAASSVADAVNTGFAVLYGSAGVTAPTERAGAVWDANYKAVYHLKEDPSGVAPQMRDSTANAKHASSGSANPGTSAPSTANKMPAGARVAGRIGFGLLFDGDPPGGSKQFVSTPNLGAPPTDVTVELWVKRTTEDGICLGELVDPASPDASAWKVPLLSFDSGGGAVRSGLFDGNNASLAVSPGSSPLTWYHIVQVYTDALRTSDTYINGMFVGSQTTGNKRWSLGFWGYGIATGGHGGGAGAVTNLGGTIDEVRVSILARSKHWILAQYNNMNSPDTFISVSPERAP